MNTPLQLERAIADSNVRKIEIADRADKALRDAVSGVKSAIMCVSGCAHCCYYPAVISVLEGIVLYRWLVNKGRWQALRSKLKSHAEVTFGLAFEVWMLSMTPCPLLTDTHVCLGYDARPLSCRLTYSVGDPLLCHPYRVGKSTWLLPRVSFQAELAYVEESLLKNLGSMYVTFPISKALLLAESICLGKLDFEALNAWIFREYKQYG